MSSPSERIAASESAISEIAAGPKEPVSSSSFIAAARRAAQAAAAAPPPEKAGRSAAKAALKDKGGDKIKADDKNPSNISSKIRSLLVGASVVVIVLGTFKMAMTLLDTGGAPQMPPMENSHEQARPGAGRRGEQRQTRDAGARRALDDLADPGRPAIEQFFGAEHAGQRAGRDPAAGGRVPDHRQRHHRHDPHGCRPPAPSLR